MNDIEVKSVQFLDKNKSTEGIPEIVKISKRKGVLMIGKEKEF
jgi:hypothetical protein